jgi:hypothetical protein
VKAQPTLDFAPLQDLALRRHPRRKHTNTGTASALADYLGTTRRTIHRWRLHGIPFHAADRVATDFGRHLHELYPHLILEDSA